MSKSFVLRIVSLIFITLLFSCANVKPSTSEFDKRLVGNWIGEREHAIGCAYYSWDITRNPDGTFVISFYSDPARASLIQRESGSWWTKKDLYYSQIEDIMDEPDIYNYQADAPESVSFQMVSADETSDCKGDYSFKDVRIQ